MASLADRLDGFQRRRRVVGFPLAVIYKFFDDQSNYLAATITYYAFVAIFPLLLISSGVLGFLLQGNQKLKTEVLDSALSQFPIVGTQLSTPEGLRGSVVAVVFAGLAALYGILGLGQAAQNAVQVAWAVPRNSRPNPFISRARSGVLLLLAGLAVIVLATLTTFAGNVGMFGSGVGLGIKWLVAVLAAVLTAMVLALLVRWATARREPLRNLLPGALLTAVLWQLLQRAGGFYVSHVVARANDVNGVFALTLGLIALIYIGANMAVIGLQVDVVLARHLYPRALLTPFTDAVELTEADRRAYAAYAKAQRHKGFQEVRVTFDKDDLPADETETSAGLPGPGPGAPTGGGP
ncbi:MAG: YihY/virulence factor BrkB family protein [Actinomycetota bacterium]|nr:YihY/virulence factor BrkB family protein [Actinomycetota bacterium]